MSQRLRLTLLCGALVASLGLALPALANDDAGGSPSFDRAAPRSETPSERAKDESAPADERQTPVPSGCPFLDGKLELIA